MNEIIITLSKFIKPLSSTLKCAFMPFDSSSLCFSNISFTFFKLIRDTLFVPKILIEVFLLLIDKKI